MYTLYYILSLKISSGLFIYLSGSWLKKIYILIYFDNFIQQVQKIDQNNFATIATLLF